jgi:hypothetical protein
MSVPTIRPDSSRIGLTSSSVVPGYEVDSTITSVPGQTCDATVRVAAVSGPRSGSPSGARPVGTQMAMVSARARIAGSRVATKPAARMRARSASGTSPMCDRPADSPATTSSAMSKPPTAKPPSPAPRASGSPT